MYRFFAEAHLKYSLVGRIVNNPRRSTSGGSSGVASLGNSHAAPIARRTKATGMYLGSGVKRMSKGMKFNLPGVQALEFDGSHPDFISLTELAPQPEDADADA